MRINYSTICGILWCWIEFCMDSARRRIVPFRQCLTDYKVLKTEIMTQCDHPHSYVYYDFILSLTLGFLKYWINLQTCVSWSIRYTMWYLIQKVVLLRLGAVLIYIHFFGNLRLIPIYQGIKKPQSLKISDQYRCSIVKSRRKKFPCLTRVLGPSYCGEFHVTGLCRIVLVMFRKSLSHAVCWFHSPFTYHAVSLSLRMCELYIWLLYIQLCSSDCVDFNYPFVPQFCLPWVNHECLTNLSSSSTSAGSWYAMKSLPSKSCTSLILALSLLLESSTYRLKGLSVPVGRWCDINDNICQSLPLRLR